jgi:hypothetical protein
MKSLIEKIYEAVSAKMSKKIDVKFKGDKIGSFIMYIDKETLLNTLETYNFNDDAGVYLRYKLYANDGTFLETGDYWSMIPDNDSSNADIMFDADYETNQNMWNSKKFGTYKEFIKKIKDSKNKDITIGCINNGKSNYKKDINIKYIKIYGKPTSLDIFYWEYLK